MRFLRHLPLAAIALLIAAPSADAQWVNRYPLVSGMSHHVYLEGYDLPTMNVGPTDPAVSPDGGRVAFSARGWIWVLDLSTGRATRVTSGTHMDFRPAWSPDGSQLAFVRDDTRDTWIVTRTLATGEEQTINTPRLELDPAYAPDGTLYYSSAAEGTLDLWKISAPGATPERITTKRGSELTPTMSRDGSTLLYMHKLAGDRVTARNLASGEERELVAERIVSQSRPAISPDGSTAVYGWATDERYELRLVSLADPSTTVRLTTGARGLPLSPAWTPDGMHIYFTEAGADEVMRLYRVPQAGGDAELVTVRVWDWGQPTGTVRITTREGTTPVASRLTVYDGAGHPALPSTGFPTFALQHGRIYFYSPGVTEVTVPAGPVTISAVRGLTTAESSRTVTVRAGEVVDVALALQHVWDSRAAGFISSDHHFHLNYGGTYTLEPDDLVLFMKGENLDLGTPVVGNLHNRFEERQHWGYTRSEGTPLIQFAQEVRSHFLGHVSLLNTTSLFWPWIWGPGYQVYGMDDRPNSEAISFARAQGGLAGYVHPFSGRDPFAAQARGGLPVMLVADGILGNLDWLEVACLWSDALGVSALWYEFLNLGNTVALEAGTDVMTNYYRTMPVGTTRLYVDTKGAANFADYYASMRAGRSFITTGPMLLFTAGGRSPGDALPAGGDTEWELTMHSAVPVDTVDIIVNGEVVWSAAGMTEPGSKTYSGNVRLPAGGWIAARARGGEPVWPSMNAYAFAHSSPVWISRVGSTDPVAMRRAAERLGPLLDAARAQVVTSYRGEANAPRILAEFAAARARLNAVAADREDDSEEK
jgi:TolB protein